MIDARHHVFIPDTQCKPGVRLDYLGWIGQYIADHFGGKAVRVIHAGDHWDMPSLSSYDRGKGVMEGRRYTKDIAAGNDGFAALDAPIKQWKRDNPRKKWDLDLHFLFGNHEERILRAANDDSRLDGLVTLDDCDTSDWQRHDFLKVVMLDGVAYSHYFYNPMTGRPYSGENLKLRLKNLGFSFTQGHQQTLDYAVRYVNGAGHRGLVAGACYVHDEDYKGPQGNAHWRGIIVCHHVRKGDYAIMEVPLDYLCKRYEGVSLGRYRGRHYA